MGIDATEVGLIVPLAWFLFTNIFFITFHHKKRSVLWHSNMATHLPFPGPGLECSGVFAHCQRTVCIILKMVKLMQKCMVRSCEIGNS